MSDEAILELKGLVMVGFHGRDGQRALDIIQSLLGESPRKSLGWINVMRDTDDSILVDDRLSPSREHADLCARIARSANPPDTDRRKVLACVEIFEGDGI